MAESCFFPSAWPNPTFRYPNPAFRYPNLLSVSPILLSVSPERDLRYPNPAFSPALGRILHFVTRILLSVTRISFPLAKSCFPLAPNVICVTRILLFPQRLAESNIPLPESAFRYPNLLSVSQILLSVSPES